jgi:hypothetical protein
MQNILKQKQATPKPTHVLKPLEPLEGEAAWMDDGSGCEIDGTVNLGGKDRKPATITVTPGFVLNGGEIFINGGSKLVLQGSPQEPVIFRGVHVAADLGGSMTAQNVLFEGCTFSKGGGWFIHYSSKWDLEDCLLVHTQFSGLSGTDYGIRIVGCIMSDCAVPQRMLCTTPPDNAAATYRDRYNQVMEDSFIHCHIAPSFVWATQRCYFERCDLGDREAWHSLTPLQIQLAVPEAEMDFADVLNAHTTNDFASPVMYTAMSVERLTTRAMPAAKFVGAASTPSTN